MDPSSEQLAPEPASYADIIITMIGVPEKGSITIPAQQAAFGDLHVVCMIVMHVLKVIICLELAISSGFESITMMSIPTIAGHGRIGGFHQGVIIHASRFQIIGCKISILVIADEVVLQLRPAPEEGGGRDERSIPETESPSGVLWH